MSGTTTDFNKSRLGSSALEVCDTCGVLETGTILFKRHGNRNGPEFSGSRVRVKDAICEFCRFLGVWMQSEKIAPSETGLQYGAGKIITRDPKTGVDTLVAYLPFDSENREVPLEGGEKVELVHGILIRAEKDGERMVLKEFLDG